MEDRKPHNSRPVLQALSEYYRTGTERLDKLAEDILQSHCTWPLGLASLIALPQDRWATEKSKLQQLPSELADWVTCVRDLIEVEGWLFPNIGTRDERERSARRLEQLLSDINFPYEPAKVMVHAVKKGRPGAAKTKRTLAIEALEAKMLDPDFKWRRFTQKHCNCDKRPHDRHCEEAMRLAVIDLQRTLGRLGIRVDGL